MLAREVRYAAAELAMAHSRLAVVLDASTDDLGRSLEGRSAAATVFIRGVRGATVRYAHRLEEAIDQYEALHEDQD
jgi:hypothetical protein